MGQHDFNSLTDLKEIDEMGGDYDEIVEALRKLGILAGQR